ncbi:MAG: SRPBCC domain-containing protein [Bacteroidota bacterium]
MSTINETIYTKDLANKKVMVVRDFDAPVALVWQAWTDPNLLDEWWAPKPWKAKTKTMDFREGGTWLYSMVGPDGTESFCRADFQTIHVEKSFTASDAFCDENGKPTNDLPGMQWYNKFIPTATGTRVEVEISFASIEDLDKIMEMGFREGFAAAHGNLDELLSQVVV